MKTSLPNRFELRRRLVINPWLEEFATVPLKFKPDATSSLGSKCVRRWGNWRTLSTGRKQASNTGLADE